MPGRSSDRNYRIWRIKVIKRDKVCVICGSINRRAAHHKNSWSYFKDQRYNVDNGVCLCGKHHIMLHTVYKRSYKEKCTEHDFNEFMLLADNFKNVGKKLALLKMKKDVEDKIGSMK